MLYESAFASVTGASSSNPTKDQVPLEMYAESFVERSGTPATADAVSCEPTATTAMPSRLPWPLMVPTLVPGL